MITERPAQLDSPVFRTLREASPLFARLEEDGPECLAFLEAGREERHAAGDRVVGEGEPAAFFIVLDGEVQAKRHREGRTFLVNTIQPGDFFGDVPLLLGSPFFASFDAVRDARLFRLDETGFWQMLAHCRTVTREVLQTMARRLKGLESIGQEQGKLASLGTMTAGLAHELNNPAAAARRAATELRATVRASQEAACFLGKTPLPLEARRFLVELQSGLGARPLATPTLSALERSDREDRLAEWLDRRGVEEAWDAAPALVSAGLDERWLEDLAGRVPAAALPIAIRWLERSLTVLELMRDVETSAARIGDVVHSVRSYSFMDQAPRQEIDLHAGLDDTLAIMSYKLRGLRVEREYDRSLPRFETFGSELNQVWTNLIDNAADAAGEGGEIRIRTFREGDFAGVEIRDNGPGIATEVAERLFEPFFTTKAIGKGTGLGLVTSRRIVAGRHGGTIRVESRPGDTRFEVRLPLRPPTAGGGVERTPPPGEGAAPSAAPLPGVTPMSTAAASETDRGTALRAVPLLAPLVEEGGAVLRLLDRAEEVLLGPGEPLGREGEPPFFSVIVEGEVRVTKQMDGQEVCLGKQGPGAFLGEIPLLLGGPFVGSVHAVTPSLVYRFQPGTFWEIIGACPRASRIVLSTLAERLHGMMALASNREKLSALGTLAAGLAHELNNPAGAARRAASQLRETVLAQQSFVCHLGTADLTPEQRELVQQLQHTVTLAERTPEAADPVTFGDRSDAVAAWLERAGVPDSWKAAPFLASARLDQGWLESLRGQLPAAVLPDVVNWVARSLEVESLLDEIETSTRRIATVVKAVKSYTYAERTQPQPVDLRESLEEALTLVEHKLPGITVVWDLDPSLPAIPGYPSELSQVWASLLDNAADALDGRGELRIRTVRERGQALVEIRDTGPGIPPELQRRIWNPFFTTKAVGQGQGLGLVTSHRIVVDRHQGDIVVQSSPGDTRFQVRLPLSG